MSVKKIMLKFHRKLDIFTHKMNDKLQGVQNINQSNLTQAIEFQRAFVQSSLHQLMDLLPPYVENEDAPTNEAKIAVLMGAVKDVIKIEALNTKRTSSKSQKNSRENSKDRNQMGSARGSVRGSFAPPSTNTSSSIYSLP